MTSSSGSGGLLSGGPVRLLIAMAVLLGLLLVFLTGWCLGGGVWRGEVSVMEVRVDGSNWIELTVAGGNGDPVAEVTRATDAEVWVKVVASSTPLKGGGDCVDIVGVRLHEPPGDRVVVDKHTGEPVVVIKVEP